MKLFFKSIILLVWMASFVKNAEAFDSTSHKKVNATILLPLYLDSTFKDGNYQFGYSIPKHILPTLEFLNGVQLAADSLEQEGIRARIEIIDSRKEGATTNIYSLYNYFRPGLVIGVVQSPGELKYLAEQAHYYKVPFISATYPNDAGITGNSDLLIVNSTLRTHCFALYQYLQKNYSGSNIVMVTRKSGDDDRIKNYLQEAGQSAKGSKLKWSVASLPASFNPVQLAVYLDSNRTNIVIGASLDRTFSLGIIETLSSLKNAYRSSIFGMPTWDDFPLQRREYNGIDVYYSTPFITYSGNAGAYRSIAKKFKTLANSNPSDMVYKGFEITYRYIKTLYRHPNDFLDHINDTNAKVFADFKFEPVTTENGSNEPDYWENSKIYFIKKTDGEIKGVY